MIWILLVLVYGILKGFREIAKKEAMEDHSVMEILFFYSLIAFVLVLPTAGDALTIEKSYLGYIFVKSVVIFVAWILSFWAIKKLPISTYGVLDLSRVLFSTFFGVAILKEVLSLWRIGGIILVGAGLLLMKWQPGLHQEHQELATKHQPVVLYLAAFASCFLNALSGLMDKLLMKHVTSSQLQVWYMLFLVLLYWIFILIRKIPLRLETLKCKWVWVLSILFVIADKALFIANSYPDSQVSVMTLLKQAGCVVTILAGKFLFKEKNTGFKFLCAGIMIVGIFMGTF